MWELGSDSDDPEWREVETPFDFTLHHVCQTVDGPYAVGAGGTVVTRDDEEWMVVMDDGPATKNNELRAMAVTTDGERLWFAGSSGALGCYDVLEKRKFDYSFPHEMTSTWEGMTVAGPRGSEKGLVSNGSGEVLPFVIDGYDVDWGQAQKPDDRGSRISGLDASPDGYGFAIDTSGNVFRTTKENGWEDIGIVNAQVKFYGVHAKSREEVFVAAGDGRIYRYDDSYQNWTGIRVTKETSIHGVSAYEDELVALGGGGRVFQRSDDTRWEECPVRPENDLYDISLGTPDIAVGDSGTVIERARERENMWGAGTSADDDQFDGRGEAYDGDGTEPA